MKKILALSLGFLLSSLVSAATFTTFTPATGVLKGNASSPVTTAATSGDIFGLFTGSCNAGVFARGDGACSATLSSAAQTFTVYDSGAGENRLRVMSDGGILLGAPTGGSQGPGTINATAMYINGDAVGTSSGAVSSVALAMPSVFTVSGSPVTSAGTLTAAFATGQTANRVLASPDGTTGAVSLRALVADDLPAIDLTTGVTGILPGANGGTANGFTAFSGPATSLKTFTLPNASSTILTTNAAVTVAQGGTGAATLTGPLKGNGTSAFTAAVSSDIYGLWSGSCTSATFLRGDGSCQTPSGVAGGSTTQVQYNSSGALAGEAAFTYNDTTDRLTTGHLTTGNVSATGTVTTTGIIQSEAAAGATGVFLANTTNGAASRTVVDLVNQSLGVGRIAVSSAAYSTGFWSGGISGAQLAIGTPGALPISIGTNNSERIRITSAGEVLFPSTSSGQFIVGATSGANGYTGQIVATGTNTAWLAKSVTVSSSAMNAWNNAAAGDNVFTEFYSDTAATLRGSVSYNRAGGLVVYNTTSDARLKKNIKDAPSASTLIDAIKVRSFDWKDSGNHVDHWFVAQELYQVAPIAVTKGDDSQTDIEKTWAVDPSKLVPLLVKELQELRARVAVLEAEKKDK